MATTALKGSAFVLKMATTASGNTYSTVAACRSNSLVLNKSAVDITNKGSGGWTESLAGGGVKNATISASGVYVDDTAQGYLRSAFFANTHWNAEIVFENEDAFLGAWNIDSLTFGGDSDVEQTFEVTMSSSGEVIFVPDV